MGYAIIVGILLSIRAETIYGLKFCGLAINYIFGIKGFAISSTDYIIAWFGIVVIFIFGILSVISSKIATTRHQ